MRVKEACLDFRIIEPRKSSCIDEVTGCPREKIGAPEKRLIGRLGKDAGNGRDNTSVLKPVKCIFVFLSSAFDFFEDKGGGGRFGMGEVRGQGSDSFSSGSITEPQQLVRVIGIGNIEIERDNVLAILGVAAQGIEHGTDVFLDEPGGISEVGFGVFLLPFSSCIVGRVSGVPIVNASERGSEVFAELGDVVGFDDNGSDGIVSRV